MKWPAFEEFDLKNRTILLGLMGSHSHGTYIAPAQEGIDDVDVMGICVPPKEYYLGLRTFEQCDVWVDEYDIVIYEIRKFFRLLLKSNPNVLGLLWLPDGGYLLKTPHGETLIKSRDLFVSKQAYLSFVGYAEGQLKRMTHFKFEGYMGKKRKELVEKFGYDTKNAAHLIRLLRMGIEFLETGSLNVRRSDAEKLMEIKRGNVAFARIEEMAKELFESAKEAHRRSSLPDKPDTKNAEKLLVEIVGTYIAYP